VGEKGEAAGLRVEGDTPEWAPSQEDLSTRRLGRGEEDSPAVGWEGLDGGRGRGRSIS
jgi:hypothetical protein